MNLEELIASLPAGDRENLLVMANQYQNAILREEGANSFMTFVKTMWPGFISAVTMP